MLEKYSRDVIERAKKIRLLLLDVDGVLTDGRIVYDNQGNETKNFNVNDGLGIILLKRTDIKCVIVTAKSSRVVTKRARELKIDKVYHNFHYKMEALEAIRKKFDVTDEQICYVGDDVIDVPVLKKAGLAVCPTNALEDVKPHAHLVTGKAGGWGAVREVCDLLINAQGKWDEVMKRYFE